VKLQEAQSVCCKTPGALRLQAARINLLWCERISSRVACSLTGSLQEAGV
jgi:hypothetical protein